MKYLYRDAINRLTVKQKAEVVGRWQAFDPSGLGCAPIQSETMVRFANSLVGKEFRVVLQGAAFVLFPYLSAEHRHLWTLLSYLASYAFQTEIENKAVFLRELKIIINRVVHKLVSITAQWTNKPKFHHLIHLVESIDMFGPAPLFATEKFESFNSIIRNASVHSNRQGPGHDIAKSTNNWRLLRILLSGCIFDDLVTHRNQARAGIKIREFFNQSQVVRQSLGLRTRFSKASDDEVQGQNFQTSFNFFMPTPIEC